MSTTVARTLEVRDILISAMPQLQRAKDEAIALAARHFRTKFQERGMQAETDDIDTCARVIVAAVWGSLLMPVECKDSVCLRAEAIHTFAGALRILAFGEDDVKELHADISHAVEHMENEHPELADDGVQVIHGGSLREVLARLFDPATMGTPPTKPKVN